MASASSYTTNSKMSQNPLVKSPVAINMATRTGDLEDDHDIKPNEKQMRKEPTSVSPTKQDKAAINTAAKTGDLEDDNQGKLKQNYQTGLPKKPEEKPQTKSTHYQTSSHQPDQANNQPITASLLLHKHTSEHFPSMYNPYEDLQAGKSEEEVIAKLKSDNLKLRKELRAISEDLTVLLEKKKMAKTGSDAPRVKEIMTNAATSEKGLQSELEAAQKQLERYKKENSVLKNRFEAQATYDKFEKREAYLFETESKIQEMILLKRQMDKSLREKEKGYETLLQETDMNYQMMTLDDNVRKYREKIREIERKRETLEKLAEKRKEFTAKLVEEIQTLKQEYKKVQEKTKYEPTEKPKQEAVSIIRVGLDKNVPKYKRMPLNKFLEEEEIPCTPENFEKLKKEIKVLQRADGLKEKKIDRELVDIQEQIAQVEKIREDVETRTAEKKKEIALLNTKLKDLSRIVRHHAVLPLQKEEENLVKEFPSSLISRERSPNYKSRGTSPRRGASPKRGGSPKKEILAPKKPQPYHLLKEYAKHNFQSKGFRKDERGNPLREDEGVNFNDRDIIGKQRVKIIAMDVWHNEQHICGLQGVYENEKGDIIEGGPHIMNSEGCKMVTFETLEEDFIQEISGFMNKNETVLECLIMRTFRGEVMKVGQPSRDGKLFKFDINEMEYPTGFYGSIRKGENGGCSSIARLGVLIATQSVEENIRGKEKEKETKKSETVAEKEKMEITEDMEELDEKTENAEDKMTNGHKSGVLSDRKTESRNILQEMGSESQRDKRLN